MTIIEIAQQHNGRKFGRKGFTVRFFFDAGGFLSSDTIIGAYLVSIRPDDLMASDWEWRETF